MSASITENYRDRLGRMVRDLWISWAERQPDPKPSWLVPYDQLSESDKEADRVIGCGMCCEFVSEVTGERIDHDALLIELTTKGLAEKLQQNWERKKILQAMCK